MEFEWDEAKRRANIEKHGLDFRDAPAAFGGPCLFAPVPFRSERRWVLVGRLGPRYVTIIFTLRAGAFRLISMRRSRDGERAQHRAVHGG